MTRLSLAALSVAFVALAGTAAAAPATPKLIHNLGCTVVSVDRATGTIAVRLTNSNGRSFLKGKIVNVKVASRVAGVSRTATFDVALPAQLKPKGAVNVEIRRGPRLVYSCSASVATRLDVTAPAKNPPVTRERARS